jgi:hypothetical protein
MTTFSLQAQIAEVEREIEMRVSVYTRQIAAGKLRKSEAEYRTDCMRAVLRTLQYLERMGIEAALRSVES